MTEKTQIVVSAISLLEYSNWAIINDDSALLSCGDPYLEEYTQRQIIIWSTDQCAIQLLSRLLGDQTSQAAC